MAAQKTCVSFCVCGGVNSLAIHYHLREVGEEQSREYPTERGPGWVLQLDKNVEDVGVTLTLALTWKRRFKYLVRITLGGRL